MSNRRSLQALQLRRHLPTQLIQTLRNQLQMKSTMTTRHKGIPWTVYPKVNNGLGVKERLLRDQLLKCDENDDNCALSKD
jgi:hypothetical protein